MQATAERDLARNVNLYFNRKSSGHVESIFCFFVGERIARTHEEEGEY